MLHVSRESGDRAPSPNRRSPRRPSPNGKSARSPSPQRKSSRSQSPQRKSTRSPSPQRKSSRSPSPQRKSTRPPPADQRRARSPSPHRRSAQSPVPNRRSARSPSPTRKVVNLQIHNKRSKSPIRNGIPPQVSSNSKAPHTLERFAKVNFSVKSSKRPTVVTKSGSKEGMIWQHTMEPIQRPLLKHLLKDVQMSSLACASFKAIMKYMGDFPTKKANLQGTQMTDKIFKDAMRHDELRDEIYCQIVKQLTDNKFDVSEERGWELLWLVTGLFSSSDILKPELVNFLRSSQHKLAEDCQRRFQTVSQLVSQRKCSPHWVEVGTIQHHYTQIFHFVFFPDDKSNASFQVSSTMTVGDLSKSIANRLGLMSSRGFGLFLIMAERIVALHDESDFFFDALRQQIDWEQEGIMPAKSEDSEMPKLAYQMFFLRKIWTDVVPGDDIQADTIFHYHQELRKFLQGYYKCRREDGAKLAALQFRACYGNDKSKMQNIAKRLSEFLPEDLLKSGSQEDWKRAILSMYNQPWITSMTKDAAKVAFLKIIYRWSTFGSSFFEAARVTKSDETDDVLLAINKQGVLIIDPETKDVQKTYPYNKIQGWANSGKTDFHLTIGTESTGVMKLHFKTKLGYKMDDLLTSYVRYMKRKPALRKYSANTQTL